MEDPIINRVEASGLIQLELKEWIPMPNTTACDLAAHLVDGLILMERAFRKDLKAWSKDQFSGKHVALHCSVDAILPDWAWMLVTAKLSTAGATVVAGKHSEAQSLAWKRAVEALDVEAYRDERVIVKGCATAGGPATLVAFTQRVAPVVRSLMFGEACSAVPLVKNPRP